MRSFLGDGGDLLHQCDILIWSDPKFSSHGLACSPSCAAPCAALAPRPPHPAHVTLSITCLLVTNLTTEPGGAGSGCTQPIASPSTPARKSFMNEALNTPASLTHIHWWRTDTRVSDAQYHAPPKCDSRDFLKNTISEAVCDKCMF